MNSVNINEIQTILVCEDRYSFLFTFLKSLYMRILKIIKIMENVQIYYNEKVKTALNNFIDAKCILEGYLYQYVKHIDILVETSDNLIGEIFTYFNESYEIKDINAYPLVGDEECKIIITIDSLNINDKENRIFSYELDYDNIFNMKESDLKKEIEKVSNIRFTNE